MRCNFCNEESFSLISFFNPLPMEKEKLIYFCPGCASEYIAPIVFLKLQPCHSMERSNYL